MGLRQREEKEEKITDFSHRSGVQMQIGREGKEHNCTQKEKGKVKATKTFEKKKGIYLHLLWPRAEVVLAHSEVDDPRYAACAVVVTLVI